MVRMIPGRRRFLHDGIARGSPNVFNVNVNVNVDVNGFQEIDNVQVHVHVHVHDLEPPP
jgi:hypothetical protein